ncbi:MFS transporter [Streptomyces sp. PmtG]
MPQQTRAVAALPDETEARWRATRRGRLGWYGYDWANSVFTTSVTSIFFGPYITDVSENAADADGYLHPLGIPVLAGSFYPYVSALSVLLQVFVLPLAAALTERHDKGRLLAVFAVVGACAASGMYAIGNTDYALGGLLYVAANMALGASVMVANTYLPVLASPERQDRMSTEGSAAGFLSSGVLLLIALVLYANHEALGIAESHAIRLILLVTGLWWLLFGMVSVWLLRGYGSPPAAPVGAPGPPRGGVYRAALTTVRHLWTLPGAGWFLIAFLLYNNGMQAVTALVGTFAVQEIGIAQGDLVVAVLAVQFVAFAGALVAGRLAERHSGRTVLLGFVLVWILTVIAGALIPEGSFGAFLGLCVGAGFVVGGTYALSRSVFIKLVPQDRAAEYFGVFETVNRCLAFLGTAGFGFALQWTGSYRVAWLSLLVFFVSAGPWSWSSGPGPAAGADPTERTRPMGDRAPAPRRRVLLTEASSASAREILTVLGRHGHEVGVMDSGGLAFTALSRWVKHRHKSPRFSADPARYLDALRRTLASHPYDVLLPTHEQLVALSRHREEFRALGVGLAVPGFDAVRRAQDKAEAVRVLDALELPQPDTDLVRDEGELLAQKERLPLYVKLSVATSSRGVWRADEPEDLSRIAALPVVRDVFAHGGEVLAQLAVPGPVVMVQALFDQGVLVGAHTALRTREGVQGSAAAKESVALPEVAEHLAALGAALDWHGPLSLDAVLDQEAGQVRYIDVNPRLVEPVNAELAGVDLVRRWLALACGEPAGPPPVARPGVRTHMLLMAVVRHAEAGRGRRAVLRELAQAAARRGWYARSQEELLPLRSDPGGALLLGAVSACLLVSPRVWQRLAGIGAPAHALSAEGWRQLLETEAR